MQLFLSFEYACNTLFSVDYPKVHRILSLRAFMLSCVPMLVYQVVTFQSPSSAENGSQASSSTFSSSSTSASSELDYRLFLDFVMAFDALREKPPPPPPPPLPLLPALPTNTSSTTPPLPPPSRAPHSPKNSTSSTDESSLHCVSSNSCSKSTRGGGSHVSAALRYFWPLLDVHHCGYLDSSTLAYLFGSVRRRLIRSGASGSSSDGGDEANAAAAPLVGDVLDEIFDMVKPQGMTKEYETCCTPGPCTTVVYWRTCASSCACKCDKRRGGIARSE